MILYKNRILINLLILICLLSSDIFASATLTPGLESVVINNADDSAIEVVVFLDDESERNNLKKTVTSQRIKRSDRIKSVISKLHSYNSIHKISIQNFLEANSLAPLKEAWIVPAFTAMLKKSDIKILSEMAGIKKIVENVNLTYDPPVEISDGPQRTPASIANELNMINVPYLWSRGLKGKGRIICSFDTGVELSHPALASKWRGNNRPLSESWFSKANPASLPYDATGHGTHTMGIMVGSLAADTFGVAPEAEWISAGIIDQGRSLSVTISDILEAFQWALNPDGDTTTTDDVPDVILNSWGFPKGLFVPCDDTFWGVIDNVEAAGIVTIFSAGNEGPEPKTLRSPADRASSPLNAFAVGAVNISSVIADFSSRGPSSCDNNQIKPEIVAPGVSIRSCDKDGGFKLMSGTSMAAPYIAAAVALIRQYNPDVTPDEIKNALILSATDLGNSGEDNAYGHGLVNLAKVLNYIPSPIDPNVTFVGTKILDDQLPLPGSSINLQITLSNSPANLEKVTGRLLIENNGSQVLANDIAEFYFGLGGTNAVNFNPFEITFDKSIYHGQIIEFQLALSSSDIVYNDTINFSLTVGLLPAGKIADQRNNRLSLTISDFGQFGFASGSIYNLLKDGFTVDNNSNLLYEAGIIVARNNLQLSSSVRSQDGTFRASDFTPFESLSEQQYGADGSVFRTAGFNDIKSEIPIPINIYQKSYHFEEIGYEGLIFFDYFIKNQSIETHQGLNFGLLTDFDLGQNDKLFFDESLIYQRSIDGIYVGLVGLENVGSFKSYLNNSEKIGFDNHQLYEIISNNISNVDSTTSGDQMFIVNSPTFDLNPGEIYKFSFAYVIGSDLSELYQNAQRAKEKYDLTTDVVDIENMFIPDDFALYQNYPNPFNPTTTISFFLPESGQASLDIFNVLGQKVKNLISENLTAGTHNFLWDATTENGEKISSGIYFYRLRINDFYKTRKMLLMK